MTAIIHAPESELFLLAAALFDPRECEAAFERVKPEHFREAYFARIWEWMRQQAGRIDVSLAIQAFENDPTYAAFKGPTFFGDLLDRATTVNLDAHIDAVLDASVRRSIQRLGLYAADEASKVSGHGERLLTELERAAGDIARDGAQRSSATPLGLGAVEMLETAYAGGFRGASLGLEVFDRITAGIRQDDVWFIGGRTSMGKSVVLLCLGRNIAEQGRGVLFFSLEMPKREVQARVIADIAYDRRIVENGADGGNVRYGDILKGRGSPGQRERAKDAGRKLASLPFVVRDEGGLTIDDIRAEAQRQFRAWERAGVPRGAILIDHIGLVKAAEGRRSDSKAAETADIVNELKPLAKQLGVPIIVACQVNRQTESRNDKRPTLADLNWSGAIEQIADFICLLYREAYYLERSPEDDADIKARAARYDIEFLVHKNRSGPICSVKGFVDIACNAIRDIDPSGERRFG